MRGGNHVAMAVIADIWERRGHVIVSLPLLARQHKKHLQDIESIVQDANDQR
jgi:hypothetical protein